MTLRTLPLWRGSKIGSLLASFTKMSVCSARYSVPLPSRSSSMKVTPLAEPTPAMAGGWKHMVTPSETLVLNSLFSSAVIALALWSGLGRSSQGFSITKKKALFVLCTPVRRLNPEMAITSWTFGFCRISSLTLSAAAVVSWRERASGMIRAENR